MAYLIAVPAPGKARGRAIDEGSVDTGGLTRTMRSTAHPRRDYLGRRVLGRSMLATRAVCARLRVCHSMVPQLRSSRCTRRVVRSTHAARLCQCQTRALSPSRGYSTEVSHTSDIQGGCTQPSEEQDADGGGERGVHTAERHRARSCCRTSGGATLQPENRWSREREREGV